MHSWIKHSVDEVLKVSLTTKTKRAMVVQKNLLLINFTTMNLVFDLSSLILQY